VSRVGGDAQTKAMRQVSGQLRLDLAQYRELAAFAQFASDLDTATRNQLERGARLTELLKQDKYQPVPLAEQVAVLYAGTQGFLDKVPVARVREWEAGFVRFLKSEEPDLLAEIEKQMALDDKLFERLKAAIANFNHQFGVEVDKATEAPKSDGKSAPKAQAPTAGAEAKGQAPAKAETAGAPAKAEEAEKGEERPSQLNQIRAAVADSPVKPAPAAGPAPLGGEGPRSDKADTEPKPKPKPRKPKAN
jgi:hypothetical protein